MSVIDYWCDFVVGIKSLLKRKSRDKITAPVMLEKEYRKGIEGFCKGLKGEIKGVKELVMVSGISNKQATINRFIEEIGNGSFLIINLLYYELLSIKKHSDAQEESINLGVFILIDNTNTYYLLLMEGFNKVVYHKRIRKVSLNRFPLKWSIVNNFN